MRKLYFIISLLFFINILLAQEGEQIPIELKREYEQFAFNRLIKLEEIIKKILISDRDSATINFYQESLVGFFYDKSSRFWFRFDEDKPEISDYTYMNFVYEIIKYKDVVFEFKQIYRDTLKLGVTRTIDREKNSKTYPDQKIGVDIVFIGVLKDDLYRNIFPATFYLKIHNNYGRFFIEIDRIKEVEGDDIPKGGRRGDFDGDGVKDKDDDCIREPGEKGNGCPKTLINQPSNIRRNNDKDGDDVIDSLDLCPDIKGEIRFKGCPDTTKLDSEDESIINTNCFPICLIPTYGDYKVRGKQSGPHWLWAAGSLSTAGLGFYFQSSYKQPFPNGIPRVEEYQGDMEVYRKAKLDKQNSLVFFGTSALILLLDITETTIFCFHKQKELKKAIRPSLSFAPNVGQKWPALPTFGVNVNLNKPARP